MSGRLRSLGAAVGLAGVLTGAVVVACYDVPTPACGFQCGPDGACPDEYTCAADRYCHRNGALPGLVCTHPDAALPVDAAIDAAIDAPPDAVDAVDAVDAP